ncbi:MAG TPA: hypothetical protein VM182_10295, partial [Terriglobia bacterium]|nr:hypothetical protein [Terriglobia bacterium]
MRLNGICDMRRDTVVMRNNEIKRLTAEIARLHEHWDSVQRANTRKCTEIELLQANQAKALEALVRLYNAQNGPPSIRRQ